MKLFGVKIDLLKAAKAVAKVAAPIAITAIVLHQPLKTAVLNAARKALDERDAAGA